MTLIAEARRKFTRLHEATRIEIGKGSRSKDLLAFLQWNRGTPVTSMWGWLDSELNSIVRKMICISMITIGLGVHWH